MIGEFQVVKVQGRQNSRPQFNLLGAEAVRLQAIEYVSVQLQETLQDNSDAIVELFGHNKTAGLSVSTETCKEAEQLLTDLVTET